MEVHLTIKALNGEISPSQRNLILNCEDPVVKVGRASKSITKGLLGAANNAWFDSPVMSRNHAEISLDGGKVVITDVGSMHGTFLNAQRIPQNRPHCLRSGDYLLFGAEVSRGTETYPACNFLVEYRSLPVKSIPTVGTFTCPESSDLEDEYSDDDISSRQGEPSSEDGVSIESSPVKASVAINSIDLTYEEADVIDLDAIDSKHTDSRPQSITPIMSLTSPNVSLERPEKPDIYSIEDDDSDSEVGAFMSSSDSALNDEFQGSEDALSEGNSESGFHSEDDMGGLSQGEEPLGSWSDDENEDVAMRPYNEAVVALPPVGSCLSAESEIGSGERIETFKSTTYEEQIEGGSTDNTGNIESLSSEPVGVANTIQLPCFDKSPLKRTMYSEVEGTKLTSDSTLEASDGVQEESAAENSVHSNTDQILQESFHRSPLMRGPSPSDAAMAKSPLTSLDATSISTENKVPVHRLPSQFWRDISAQSLGEKSGKQAFFEARETNRTIIGLKEHPSTFTPRGAAWFGETESKSKVKDHSTPFYDTLLDDAMMAVDLTPNRHAIFDRSSWLAKSTNDEFDMTSAVKFNESKSAAASSKVDSTQLQPVRSRVSIHDIIEDSCHEPKIQGTKRKSEQISDITKEELPRCSSCDLYEHLGEPMDTSVSEEVEAATNTAIDTSSHPDSEKIQSSVSPTKASNSAIGIAPATISHEAVEPPRKKLRTFVERAGYVVLGGASLFTLLVATAPDFA